MVYKFENLRLREHKARKELKKLADKEAKQLKIRQIQEEVNSKLNQDDLENKNK